MRYLVLAVAAVSLLQAPAFSQTSGQLSEDCRIDRANGTETCRSRRPFASSGPYCDRSDLLQRAIELTAAGQPRAAEGCYRKLLATREDKYAQYNLGRLLIERSGDAAEAIELFRLAARSGSRYANYELGVYHYKGTLVAHDNCKALSYLKKAQRLGETRGAPMIDTLGRMYLRC